MDNTQAEMLKEALIGANIDGWTISGFYGNGKSAVVMMGERDGRQAAIKVFHPELVERYGRDVQLARVLRETSLVNHEHPNLVQIFGGGACETTNYIYVAMEPLPYKNLHDALSEIPADKVTRIISQVASAARFLEDRGLAHRDIKPENIAISDDFERAVLLDLGVLRPIGGSDLTDVDQRQFIGTLRYSSPEFLLREEEESVDGWRAITFYQLGAVLHDMLMRKVLFADRSEPFSRLVHAVTFDTPAIVSGDTRSADLARRCLIKNPITRLELVHWGDFLDASPIEGLNLAAAREKIRSRQKLAKAIGAQDEVGVPPQRKSWKIDVLNDLRNRFDSRLSMLMNDLGCFPPRSVYVARDEEISALNIVITYAADKNLGIDFKISIGFQITLIDENSGDPIFRAMAASAFSRTPCSIFSAGTLHSFYTGTAEGFLDSAELPQYFLDSLDAYYATIDSGRVPEGDNFIQLIEKNG